MKTRGALRLFTLSFLLFASLAFVAPFVVLYYQNLDFTGAQIGLLAGLSPLITLFSTPLWAGLADATRRHRPIMSLAILGGAITLLAFPLLNSFAPILLASLLYNAFYAPISSFADSATMFMLADEKEMYGRIRLGGTIGFGLAAPAAGVLVQKYGLPSAFWGGAALLLLALGVGQTLRFSPLKTGDSAGRGLHGLLANRRWLLFLAAAFAGGLSVAAVNAYLFSYLKEMGATEFTMGLSLTIGTLSEIPVLFFGHQLLKRLTPYGVLLLAMVATGVRLLLLAASSIPAHILWVQLLNGLAFPAMWIAGVAYADQSAPPGLKTTAQALFGAVLFGFGAAVGGFAGGPLLENFGGRGLYLVFGVIVIVITALIVVIQKNLPVEPDTSPKTAM